MIFSQKIELHAAAGQKSFSGFSVTRSWTLRTQLGPSTGIKTGSDDLRDRYTAPRRPVAHAIRVSSPSKHFQIPVDAFRGAPLELHDECFYHAASEKIPFIMTRYHMSLLVSQLTTNMLKSGQQNYIGPGTMCPWESMKKYFLVWHLLPGHLS